MRESSYGPCSVEAMNGNRVTAMTESDRQAVRQLRRVMARIRDGGRAILRPEQEHQMGFVKSMLVALSVSQPITDQQRRYIHRLVKRYRHEIEQNQQRTERSVEDVR